MTALGAGVGFLVFGALWVVLAVFLRKGANWARIVLTVLAGLGMLFGAYGLGTSGQPAIFVVVAIVQFLLYAALLFFLWRRESTAYLTGGWQA